MDKILHGATAAASGIAVLVLPVKEQYLMNKRNIASKHPSVQATMNHIFNILLLPNPQPPTLCSLHKKLRERLVRNTILLNC